MYTKEPPGPALSFRSQGLLNYSFVLLGGMVVDGIQRPLHGLTCHDVHVPGEEHAAASPLAHRLDEGVLDLREVARRSRGIRVLDDLRGADEEERIVAGEDIRVDDDRTVRVGILRGLVAVSRVHVEPGAAAVDVHLLLMRDTERKVVTLAEVVLPDEHPNAPGVDRLPQTVEHGHQGEVAHAEVRVLRKFDPLRSPGDLVHDGQGAVAVVVKVASGIVLDHDAVRLSIGHDHQGRDLNVVGLNPVHHHLRGDGHGLNGRGAAQVQEMRTAAIVLDQAFVQVGEERFTGRGRVLRGREGDEFGATHHGCVRRVALQVGIVMPRQTHVLQVRRVNVGEPVDLKRNLDLLAEPNQLENLKEAVPDAVGHRTAQVEEEHDAVVLALLLDDLADEDIVVGAELVQLVHVEEPGLLGTLTADLVRCLAAVELRGQLADECIGFLDELAVLRHVYVTAMPQEVADEDRGGNDRVLHVLQAREAQGGRAVLLPGLGSQSALVRGHLVHGALRALLVALAHLLLVLLDHLLYVRVLVESLRHGEHFRERGHAVHDGSEFHLLRVHRDFEEAGDAPLEVEVEAVQDVLLVHVHLGELEQVGVHDLLVAEEEVTASTGVLGLHHLLDANVLDHVGDALKEGTVEALRLRCGEKSLALMVGSPQGVADLVGDQHGLHGFRHIPDREDKVSGLHIERGSLCGVVEREGQVFGCECASEDGERIVHARIVTDGGSLSRGRNERKQRKRCPVTAGGYLWYQGYCTNWWRSVKSTPFKYYYQIL